MMKDALLRNPVVHLAVIAALCAAGSACSTSKKSVRSNSLQLTASGQPRDALRDALADAATRVRKPSIRSVVFPYNSYTLDRTARDVLKANAELLRTKEGGRIVIEGHCDERGTTEYNLALGEQRALAVLEYYGMLGITKDRMRTISYGEEQPLCVDHREDCRRLNRRARTLVD